MRIHCTTRLAEQTFGRPSSEGLEGPQVVPVPSPLLGLPTPQGWKLMPGVLATAS